MKTLAAAGLTAVFAVCGFAQHHNSGRVQIAPATQPTYGNSTGFGRVLFPGTGHPPAVGNQFTVTDTTFASRLGSTVSGLSFNGRGSRRFREPLVTPYAYPVYVGGYGYGDYPSYGDPGYQQSPNITIVNPPQQTPQVVINQNFVPEHATPVMHDYTDDSSGVHVYEAPGRTQAEGTADDNSFYLIAFKDHSIYSAFAYWVEGDTLHYVTAQRVHNQASLSLVDRDLTDKLNRGRNLQVKLPN
ncbi:MAG TPA: hypothetical protein VJN43_17195 [Bryobacteraceae bacterium]|nr:hypothetical protein [Bryobacteraceae bacterium]